MNQNIDNNKSKKRGRPFANQTIDISKILEVAIEIFAQEGFQGARIKEIAAKAKITTSLIHYHFEGKEDLWQKAVTKLGEQLFQRFEDIQGYFKDLEGVALMKAFTRQYIYFSAEHPEFYKIIFHEMGAPSNRAKWLLDKILKPLHQQFEQRVNTSSKNQALLKNISNAHFASLLIGAGNIFFINAYQNKELYGVDSFDKEEIERYADFVNETIYARFIDD